MTENRNQPTITSRFLKVKEKNLSSMKKYLTHIKEQYNTDTDGISEWTLKDDDDQILSRGLVFMKKVQDPGSKKKEAFHKIKYQGGKIYDNG